MDLGSVIEIAVGALIAIVVTMAIEYRRLPRLSIRIAQPATLLDDKSIALRLIVQNRPQPDWLKWLGRETASHCIATHTIWNDTGIQQFEYPVIARWTGSPEPQPLQVAAPDNIILLNVQDHFDLPAGQRTNLDVAVRAKDETIAYLFVNQSYKYPQFKHPSFELAPGNYVVETTIKSGGRPISHKYFLENPLHIEGYKLSECVEP